MAKFRVGCKKHLISSKNGGVDLIFADVKKTTETYNAFEITVPDEGIVGKEEMNVTCPDCNNDVKIQLVRERPIQYVKDSIFGAFFISGILSIVGLIVSTFAVFIAFGLLLLLYGGILYIGYLGRGGGKIETYILRGYTNDPNHFLERLLEFK